MHKQTFQNLSLILFAGWIATACNSSGGGISDSYRLASGDVVRQLFGSPPLVSPPCPDGLEDCLFPTPGPSAQDSGLRMSLTDGIQSANVDLNEASLESAVTCQSPADGSMKQVYLGNSKNSLYLLTSEMMVLSSTKQTLIEMDKLALIASARDSGIDLISDNGPIVGSAGGTCQVTLWKESNKLNGTISNCGVGQTFITSASFFCPLTEFVASGE